MTVYNPFAGDTLPTIAARELGDWRNWRDIADLNNLSPLKSIPLDQINLPSIEDLTAKAEPALASVTASINAGGSQILSALQQVEAIVPGAAGYSKIAQQALGEVNGVLGQASSLLSKAKTTDVKNLLRDYTGQIQKIDWLLN